LELAQGLRQHGAFCYPGQVDKPDAERMPVYPGFLATVFWTFGGSLLAVVLVQILVDSLSCVLVCKLGEMLWKGNGFLSGILASLNLGMITYSHFILNDSLFLFVFLFFLIGLVRYLREPGWEGSVLLGMVLGQRP